MKIIVDENITCGKEAFSKLGDVILYPGREISKSIVKDADALIVRSITKVDENLLEESKIKFVGTATIGFDHIDTKYLADKKIEFTTAAGCNSFAVAEYVMSSLAFFTEKNKLTLQGKSIGIVGVGNIGKIIEKFSKALGLKTVLNDPPLKRETGDPKYKSLDEALACDIISLHVPLNKSGIDKTIHLIDEENLKKVKSGSVLINSCRGPVVDNQALKKRLQKSGDLLTVFDVWENEPAADLELLTLIDIATAHIAGYSYEGKINGTKIIFDHLKKFLGSPVDWKTPNPLLKSPELEISSFVPESFLQSVFKQTYQADQDSQKLKQFGNLPENEFVKHFDQIRKNYPFRRELSNYIVKNKLTNAETNLLEAFRIKNSFGD